MGVLQHKAGERVEMVGARVTEVFLGEDAVHQCLLSGEPGVANI